MKYLKFFSYLVLFCWSSFTEAAPLDHWHWVSPLPQGNALNNVQYLNNQFVAVGDGGTVMHSLDATNWTIATTPFTDTLISSAYGNGNYVVGGEFGVIWTSSDLTTWTMADTPVFYRIQSITFGNGLFLACTDGGEIIKSTDGQSWTLALGPMFIDFRSVHFFDGNFWLGGAFYSASKYTGSESILMRSTDGTDWHTEDIGGMSAYTCISDGNGELLVVEAGAYSSLHIRNTNGIWRQNDIPNSEIDAIIYAQGRYLGCSGNRSLNYLQTWTAGNDLSWSAVSNLDPYRILSAAFGNGVFAAVGISGAICHSADAISFESSNQSLVTTEDFYDIAASAERIVAVGNSYAESTAFILSKAIDSDTFETTSFEVTGVFNTVVWTGEKFVTLGENGLTAWSADGVNWTSTTIEGTPSIMEAVYGNGRIVGAVRQFFLPSGPINNAAVVVSEDGESWTIHDLSEYGSIISITYGMGYFWILSASDKLYRSVDGTNWELINADVPYGVSKFSASNDRLLIIDASGNTAVSLDGLHWQEGTTGLGGPFVYSVKSIQNQFVAVVNSIYYSYYFPKSRLITSRDGLNWTQHGDTFHSFVKGITYGDGRYFVLGDTERANPILMQSDISVNLELSKQTGSNLTIDGAAGHYYQIQRSPSVGSDANWQQIDRVFCPTMPFTFEDSTATGSGPYFYRTIMEPEYISE